MSNNISRSVSKSGYLAREHLLVLGLVGDLLQAVDVLAVRLLLLAVAQLTRALLSVQSSRHERGFALQHGKQPRRNTKQGQASLGPGQTCMRNAATTHMVGGAHEQRGVERLDFVRVLVQNAIGAVNDLATLLVLDARLLGIATTQDEIASKPGAAASLPARRRADTRAAKRTRL